MSFSPQTAHFDLEVDQLYANAGKQTGEKIIDADRHRHDVVNLLRTGPAKSGNVLFGNQGIAQLVLFCSRIQ